MIRGWLVILALLTAAPALAKDPISAFFDAGYNSCQATILAKVWNTELSEAKARAGKAVLDGERESVEQALNVVRHEVEPTGWAVCPYNEYGYSYLDAERVADSWGIDTMEAKAKIEGGLWFGTEDTVVGGLVQPAVDEKAAFEAVDVYYAEGYGYCDAAIVAATWGSSIEPWDAKVALGRRIIEGQGKGVVKELKKARKSAAGQNYVCDFLELGLEWQQVEILASAWNMSVSDAKGEIGRRMARGKTASIYKTLDKVAPMGH